MDYNRTFSRERNRIFKIKELEIKEDLKKFSSQSISHHRALGTTMIDLKKLRSEQSESEYAGLFELFTKSQQKYSKNQIKLSLENDVFPEFEKLNKTEDHAFELVIKELALITATDDVIYLMDENIRLLGLIYRSDSFDLLELKKYQINIEDTDLYKNLYSKLYPNQNYTPTIIKQDNMEDTENEDTTNLDMSDKAFLFHCMCQILRTEQSELSRDKLPSTELLRLNAICDFKDERFFNAKYRDSAYYKILTKGIDYFKTEEKQHFLNSLILKIGTLQLSQTEKFLKATLNKQYNIAVKK